MTWAVYFMLATVIGKYMYQHLGRYIHYTLGILSLFIKWSCITCYFIMIHPQAQGLVLMLSITRESGSGLYGIELILPIKSKTMCTSHSTL